MFDVAKGTIINKVSELMGRNRMSIKDLERAADISYQTAFSLYHDQTRRIDFDTLIGLCEAFNVGIGDILQYAPIPKSKNGDG